MVGVMVAVSLSADMQCSRFAVRVPLPVTAAIDPNAQGGQEAEPGTGHFAGELRAWLSGEGETELAAATSIPGAAEQTGPAAGSRADVSAAGSWEVVPMMRDALQPALTAALPQPAAVREPQEPAETVTVERAAFAKTEPVRGAARPPIAFALRLRQTMPIANRLPANDVEVACYRQGEAPEPGLQAKATQTAAPRFTESPLSPTRELASASPMPSGSVVAVPLQTTQGDRTPGSRAGRVLPEQRVTGSGSPQPGSAATSVRAGAAQDCLRGDTAFAPPPPVTVAELARVRAMRAGLGRDSVSAPPNPTDTAPAGSTPAEAEQPGRDTARVPLCLAAELRGEGGGSPVRRNGAAPEPSREADTSVHAPRRTRIVGTATNAITVATAAPGVMAEPAPPGENPVRRESPETRMEPERYLETTEPAARAPAATRRVDLRLGDPNAGGVDVQVVDQGGRVRVAVRTANSDLGATLREHLSSLVSRLETGGFHTETWTPAGDAAPEQRGAAGERQGTSYGEGQRRDQQHDQNGEDHRQDSPRWMEEFERNLKPHGGGSREETMRICPV